MQNNFNTKVAESLSNGIIFYSARHPGFLTLATIDEGGNITTTFMPIINYKANEYFKKLFRSHSKRKTLFHISLILFLAISLGFFCFYCPGPVFPIRIWITLKLFAYTSMFIADVYTVLLKDSTKTFKFHSAEHMIINAYRRLHRVPTMEELKTFSRFTTDCGTSIYAKRIFTFFLMFITTAIPNLWIALSSVPLAFIITYFLAKHGGLNFFQIFVTRTPTDSELNVAIEGLKAWIQNEKKEVDFSNIIFMFF